VQLAVCKDMFAGLDWLAAWAQHRLGGDESGIVGSCVSVACNGLDDA
jgi:hypothetical protein